MKLSLSGWQRLGIVLAFLWAIGILLFTAHEFYSARSHLTHASPEDKQFKDLCFVGYYETQLKVMLPSKTVSRVIRENKYLSVAFEPRIKVLTVIIIILGPVLGGWLFIYGLFFAITWVRRGFHRSCT
jgi:hypothetical protein